MTIRSEAYKKNFEEHNFIMDKDNPFERFTMHRNMRELKNNDQKNALKAALENLSAMRQQQETTFKSLNKENFSHQQKMFTTMASSLSSSSSVVNQQQTTGGSGHEAETNEDSKVSEGNLMSGACPMGKTTMFLQQKQQQQQHSIASSSSSTIASGTTKKVKTLSFLHKEDITGDENSSSTVGNMMQNTNRLMPQSATSLIRSLSFQDRCQMPPSGLKRTESGRELTNVRTVAILSPKHSMQELNDRIKRMQQQMFNSSSDISL